MAKKKPRLEVPDLWPELVKLFKEQVCDRSLAVDPGGEQDWFSLSLGWALAKGLSPEDAHRFSIYVRYEKHYWHP